MATSLRSESTGRYVNFDEYIDYQIQKTRSGVKWTDLLTALAGTAALLLGYFLVFTVFDHWVVEGGFGPFARWSMFAVVMLATVAWIGWKIVVPYLRSVNRLFAAQLIEKSEPGVKGTLLSLIDLQSARQPVSEDVRRTLEKRAALGLSRMDVDQAVDRRQLMRTSYVLLALVLIACFYTLFSPKRLSFRRAFVPAAAAPAATQTEIFNVKPGDTEALLGTPLQVTAQLGGEIPEQVTLFYTTADRTFVDQPVTMHRLENGINQYRGTITGDNGGGLLQDLTYRLVAGDARTRDFEVSIIEPPTARVTEVRYEYPDYMDLPARQRSSGHIDAWEGTQVTLRAETNMPVTSARILFSDTESLSQKAEEIDMRRLDATTLQAEWTLKLRSDGTYPHFYRIECRNDAGHTHPDPALYHLTIRPDRSPDIELLDPVRDLERPANAVVPLLFQARDPDFLLQEVELHATKNGELLLEETIWEGEQPEFGTTYEWDLEPLDLKPRDQITYWLQARDNKRPSANRNNTSQLNIGIVEAASEEEVQEQLEADKQRQQESQKPGEQEESGSREGDRESVGAGKQPQEDKPDQPGEPSPQQRKDQQRGAEQKAEGSRSESGEGQQGKQQRYSPDGEDDQEVLEKLIRDMKPQQEQKTPKDGQSRDRAQPDRPDKNEQDENQPDQNKREQKPDRNEPRPTDQPQKQDGGQKDQEPRQDPQSSQPMSKQSEQPRQSDPSQKQDPGEKQAGQEGGDGSSQDGASDGQPTPDQSQSPPETPQTGPGDQAGDSESSGKEDQSSNQPAQGQEQPGPESSQARREKATGNEQGEATPDHDPNADPTPAQNDLQRKPGEEPARRKPDDRSKPSQKSERGTGNPKDAQPAPQGKKPSQDPQADQRPSTPKNVDRPPTKRDGQPDAKNEELQGKGRPKGQKSDQPQGGEAGSSQQADQGTSGSNQPGPGDSGSQGGGQQSADRPTDQQSGGQGSQGQQSQSKRGSQPGGDASRPGQSGQSGGQQSPSGDNSAPPSGGQSSGTAQQPGGGGAGGKTGGGGTQPGRAGGGAPGRQGGEGQGGAGSPPPREDPNLQDAKEATNLVLKRLEDQMERGEVDRELLEELGWTEQEMRRFVERLQGRLNGQSDAATPEAEARRRQFEEMLKSLDLQSGARTRSGADVKNRSPQEGISSRRLPVPAEYRDVYDAYTRSLSRRTVGSGDGDGTNE